VAQVIQHRLARESLIRRLPPLEGTKVRTAAGDFTLLAFESLVDPLPHVVLTTGGVGALDPATNNVLDSDTPTLVRMHRRHLLGDLFEDLDSSAEGPTGRTLRASMEAVQRAGRGAIVYLRSEGIGDGLAQRLMRHRRPGQHVDDPDLSHAAAPMPLREFGIGGQILRALGLKRLRLLTNHTTDLPGLDAFGLEIVERVAVGGG
jgi:3,4-dihydroxy 2-butanone 4-phosphate synthase/GTP cyclohydrolase II